MRDPISGPQDLVFLAISFIVMLMVAVNPQRVFAVLNAFSQQNLLQMQSLLQSGSLQAFAQSLLLSCYCDDSESVNNTFGTNATTNDVQGDPFPNGNTTNLNIELNGLPSAQFNSIQTGRYPLNPWTYLIGYGPTLHDTGQTLFCRANALL
jgi:hypothetical protein